MKKIITISREFGSGGRTVGKLVAEKMGYKYYDKEIIEQVAEETGFFGYRGTGRIALGCVVGTGRNGSAADRRAAGDGMVVDLAARADVVSHKKTSS